MNVLVLYLSITVIGYFTGAFLTRKGIALKGMSIMQTVAIIALVFLMGSRIGADRSIVKSLDSIGLAAFVMTLFILAGSVLAVFLTRKLLGFDKRGNLVKLAGTGKEPGERFTSEIDTKNLPEVRAVTDTELSSIGDSSAAQKHVRFGNNASYHADSSDALVNAELDCASAHMAADVAAANPVTSCAPSPETDDSAGMDHTMTICIAVSVIAGILAGYFIIPEGFAEISGNLIVAGLSLLLLFVGMDIGVEGTIAANFKRAGWRVIVFPFVIMIGTYIGAAAASLVLPVTMKDALCVGSGFGWYTLAPAMLAEYSMEISAMSFMHNVMRELIGILLMPLVAAKVGYIETISLPGSSSMDVCLPIVERVTKSDIAVYSFLSGAVLSASTPIMVSFMMGL